MVAYVSNLLQANLFFFIEKNTIIRTERYVPWHIFAKTQQAWNKSEYNLLRNFEDEKT